MAHLDAIRALLRRDPVWSVYALGDLDPRRAHHCDWYVRGTSVALVYREFDLPILFAAGTPEVLGAVPDLAACLLQLPASFSAAVTERFAVEWTRPMLRMSVAPGALGPAPVDPRVVPLGLADEADILALYGDGVATHEEPDFFMRSQLMDDTFFGVRLDGRLVAAGGTHLCSIDERVGAIGNVYTHRAHRGHGYGAAVTRAVARRLADRGIDTIALNVKADNHGAIRLYERLGFRVHLPFFDGRAGRRQPVP